MGAGKENLEMDDSMSIASSQSDAGSTGHHGKSTDFATEQDNQEDGNQDDGEVQIIDPNCVAEKPYRITFQDITSASYLIKSGIECTPCTVCTLYPLQLIEGHFYF